MHLNPKNWSLKGDITLSIGGNAKADPILYLILRFIEGKVRFYMTVR